MFSPTSAPGKKLILASKSPRRAELLNAVGWPFEALPSNVDETRVDGEDAVAYVMRVARAKAETVAGRSPDAVVVGADTVVVIDGEILGQPRDDEDARRMLKLLSGKWHEVLTGVALVFDGQVRVERETTRVRFAELTDAEIDWYISTGEPRDKAGAYGIQDRAAIFVEEIEGDYFNIVGLPVRRVYELMKAVLGLWS